MVNLAHGNLIEAVERDAWLDLYAAAPGDCARDLGLSSRRLGNMGLLASHNVPIVEFNRATCVDAAASTTPAALDEALAWLQANAASAWALQIAPVAGTSATTEWLQRHAIRQSGTAWAKLVRDTAQERRPCASRLGVELVTAECAGTFGKVVQAGFGLPSATARWFAALVGRPGWRLYLAYDGDIAVASGAAFARHGLAWFGMDATLEPYRRRGAQSALISRRIDDGCAAGLAGFTAEAGQPVGSAGHSSFSNYARAGFKLAYVRANLKAEDSATGSRRRSVSPSSS